MERYSRQIMLPEIGERGQKRILASKVLIVGLGGLGCPVSLYMAGAGVGRIGLCDADTVSLSNLQRQLLYTEAQVGLPKAIMTAERLNALSSASRFDILECRLEDDNAEAIIVQYDLVMDCCDNFATRRLIDRICQKLGKPWVHASIEGFNGEVTTFMPDSPVRYTDLLPEADRPAAKGVLGAVAGTVGSIAAAEGIKILAGCRDTLAGTLLTINLNTYEFNTFDL